jgi:hypothetical protein
MDDGWERETVYQKFEMNIIQLMDNKKFNDN